MRFYANDIDLDENNPAVAWWQNPAVNLSLKEFVESTGGWQKLSGESFWLLDDTWFESRAEKSKLILARPLDMRHIVQNGQLVGWVYTDAGGAQHNLLPEEVIHMKQWNPYDPWRGLGELDAARIAVETDYAAGKYARDTFRNAGDAGAYVTSKSGIPSEAQQAQIVAALREKRAARMRGDYRPVFLAGDIAVTDPQVQAPDAAFVSNRQLSRHEIFIAFGVPASMSDVIASYSIGSASDMFRLISNTCIPLSDSIAATINRALLMQYGNSPLVRCYFDWDEHPTMQAVRRERIDSAVKLWNMGMPLERVNEYLDMELPEFTGWNRSYLPMNLMSEDSAMDEEPQPEPSPELPDVVEDIAGALQQRSVALKAQVNLQPTGEMASAASLGLKWREEYGRGGTAVGVARARDIKNRAELSPDTIGRMVSFFARHGVNRSEHYDAKESDGGPTAWRIAWQLWGGDAGRDWSEKKWSQLDDEESSKSAPETTRAATPDMEQRAMLWNRVVRARLSAEKAYLGKFTRVLADARREQIAKINAHSGMFGSDQKAVSEALVFSLNPFKNKLKAGYRQVTTAVIPAAVEQANNEIKPMAPKPPAGTPASTPASPWKMPPEKAIKFIEQRENLMAGIADDIHKGIMDVIQESMNQQLGAQATADQIRKRFNEISNGRAKTIARTETGAAYGFSREEAMQAAGIRYKEWLATPDDKCRETHRAADGQVVEIDSAFDVGGSALMYPCDPDGPPEEIINCRCVQIAVSQP